MANEPVVTFKMSVDQLDHLRATILRDYGTLNEQMKSLDAMRTNDREMSKDPKFIEQFKNVSAGMFQVENLMRFFSIQWKDGRGDHVAR